MNLLTVMVLVFVLKKLRKSIKQLYKFLMSQKKFDIGKSIKQYICIMFFL